MELLLLNIIKIQLINSKSILATTCRLIHTKYDTYIIHSLSAFLTLGLICWISCDADSQNIGGFIFYFLF